MREGHLLILPQRHVKREGLTLAELAQLRDVTVQMKDKLFRLYPSASPYLYSVTDTPQASIPEHFHYLISFPTKRTFEQCWPIIRLLQYGNGEEPPYQNWRKWHYG